MADIVEYKYDPNFPMNCSSHVDPGLLSISLFSTAPGLQFFDPTPNDWIPIPHDKNLGVIWCGDAATRASNGKIKSGIHRVQLDSTATRRVTMWYEMCTSTQLPSSFLDYQKFTLTPTNSSPPTVTGSFFIRAKTLTGKTIILTRLSKSSTIWNVKERIQDVEGIPPAKNRLIYCGKQLDDSKSLDDYGIAEGTIIHLVLALSS